jgi:hypothetical protein
MQHPVIWVWVVVFDEINYYARPSPLHRYKGDGRPSMSSLIAHRRPRHGDLIEPQQNHVQYWMYCRTEYEESYREGLYISFGRLRSPAFALAI